MLAIAGILGGPCIFAGSVRLAWDISPDQNVIGYHVYRSTESGKNFSRINPFLVRVPWYTDTSAASGNTYYYAVTAQSKSGLESALSDEVVAHIPPNQPPVANDDKWATFIDTPVSIPVLDNDVDPEGERISIIGIISAGHGRVGLSSDLGIKYSPATGFLGTDLFHYIIYDGEKVSNWATVLIAVRLPGDVNGNGRVELDDVNAIASSLRSPASGPADPRDLDQDGWITISDLQKAYSRCENCSQ